jgi:asparagine synthase (glutamine-hydrolysing)
MSMANSLEARVPLLDHPLVELACGLPPEFRLRGHESKYLLKRTLCGRLPSDVLTRPKQGFAVPLELWFNHKLPEFFDRLLTKRSRLAAAGIRPSAIQSLFDVYMRKRRSDHCRQLWALAVLDAALEGVSDRWRRR